MVTHLERLLSVLIVEDRDDAAQSTADLLALCGHTVRIARCGTDAMRQAEAYAPDVILMDIGLPDLDGWTVARWVRARPGRQPVLIAVTGHGAPADRVRSADAGVDLHLVKPADPRALTELLARIRASLSDCGGAGNN